MRDALERLAALADAEQTIHAVVSMGGTEAREFYAVIRSWPHPEEAHLRTLCVQNAQLTAEWSDMADTWLTGSYRQRVPEYDGTEARDLAQAFAATAARLEAGADDRDPATFGLESEEERADREGAPGGSE